MKMILLYNLLHQIFMIGIQEEKCELNYLIEMILVKHYLNKQWYKDREENLYKLFSLERYIYE